jgi:hypothetical protein
MYIHTRHGPLGGANLAHDEVELAEGVWTRIKGLITEDVGRAAAKDPGPMVRHKDEHQLGPLLIDMYRRKGFLIELIMNFSGKFWTMSLTVFGIFPP